MHDSCRAPRTKDVKTGQRRSAMISSSSVFGSGLEAWMLPCAISWRYLVFDERDARPRPRRRRDSPADGPGRGVAAPAPRSVRVAAEAAPRRVFRALFRRPPRRPSSEPSFSDPHVVRPSVFQALFASSVRFPRDRRPSEKNARGGRGGRGAAAPRRVERRMRARARRARLDQ